MHWGAAATLGIRIPEIVNLTEWWYTLETPTARKPNGGFRFRAYTTIRVSIS